MIKKSEIKDAVVFTTDTLEEALTLDPEEKPIDLIVIGGCKRQRVWREIPSQAFIPQELVAELSDSGEILVRVGLGYIFMLDVATRTSVKVFDTDLPSTLTRYLTAV